MALSTLPVSTVPSLSPRLSQLATEVARGNYHRALDLSASCQYTDHDIRNLRGVCLMRLGRANDAIELFRNLVLTPGGVTLRGDRPLHFKTNFATALLLGGHPAGCLEVLRECSAMDLPVGKRLESAITAWETTLPLWSRLDWRWCRNEPTNCPVVLGFEPGDLGFEAMGVFGQPSDPNNTPAAA